VLYNVMNVIDERTLETISFVSKLTSYVTGGVQGDDLDEFLPDLIWVVRDFSLELEAQTTPGFRAE
jgi:hypothetical protein